jgi:hypothetical protein
MADLRLNLGCGSKRLDGYINVDKFGDPDLQFDLETFPYPWENNSVTEIKMHHVLEHLGQQTLLFSQRFQTDKSSGRSISLSRGSVATFSSSLWAILSVCCKTSTVLQQIPVNSSGINRRSPIR